MALNIETIKNLTNKQKFLVLILLVVVSSASFTWFVFIPKRTSIDRLSSDIATLNNKINVERVKVRRLDQLRREDKVLKRKLQNLKEQLPPEAEVDFLLKQVSDLGGASGLDFKLWRPGKRIENDSGLYMEIPVKVEVAGGYHSVGIFFDKISKLRRIINVSDISMSAPKSSKKRLIVQTRFSATAFASVSEENKNKKQKGKKEAR